MVPTTGAPWLQQHSVCHFLGTLCSPYLFLAIHFHLTSGCFNSGRSVLSVTISIGCLKCESAFPACIFSSLVSSSSSCSTKITWKSFSLPHFLLKLTRYKVGSPRPSLWRVPTHKESVEDPSSALPEICFPLIWFRKIIDNIQLMLHLWILYLMRIDKAIDLRIENSLFWHIEPLAHLRGHDSGSLHCILHGWRIFFLQGIQDLEVIRVEVSDQQGPSSERECELEETRPSILCVTLLDGTESV